MPLRSRNDRERAKQKVARSATKTIKKPIGGEKNGGFRMVVVNKGPKWYPVDVPRKPVPSRKHVHKPTKLRASIKPGSILILLAGKYRGSRVVFLKQLPSGNLLVTGPYSVNRVPLKRVQQAYVIATSTVVDIKGVDVSKIDDAFFKMDKKKEKAEVMEVDAGDDKQKNSPSAEKIAAQKAVDAALVPAVEKEPLLKQYLKTKFSLRKNQFPHEMKF